MIPVIALVGRPNVGKSTLFNRLTKTQNALVADYPGLTRDRQYGQATFQNKPFIVIDTGGIGVDDLAIDNLMSKQSNIALAEADIILFLVSAREGLISIDEIIVKRLRKLNKPTYLIINKIDGLNEEIAASEFQRLGLGNNYSISATHGQGIDKLMHSLASDWHLEEEVDDSTATIKVAFIGRPNVGKSTLVNRMLGEERVVVYDMPGTTRDSIAIPFKKDDTSYLLVDTAGIRRRSRVDEKIEKFSIIKTLQTIKSVQVCLVILDAQEGLTDQDLRLLSFVVEAGRALVIAVNKWDGLSQENKERMRNSLERQLNFVHFAKIRFISALHGSGVGHLFKDINEAYHSAKKSFNTSQLTSLLQNIVEQHAPPMVHGRRIKLRYAHLGGHNPPRIIIHGNQLDALPNSYIRYLSNTFLSKLNLVGTPLQLEFKTSTNPFQGKRNKLTERQVRKRNRVRRKGK